MLISDDIHSSILCPSFDFILTEDQETSKRSRWTFNWSWKKNVFQKPVAEIEKLVDNSVQRNTQEFTKYAGTIHELKQTRRRRKQERHLKMWLRVSAIIFQLFKLIVLEKCVLTILDLRWNQRLGHKKTKLNICHHMLTSSTQLQSKSFHVVERTRTSSKCQKKWNMHVQSVQKYCFSL